MRATLMFMLLGIFVSGVFDADGSEQATQSTKDRVASDTHEAHAEAGHVAVKVREEAKVAKDRIVQSIGDALIYTKIESRLLADSDTPALKINVDVFRDVVTLRGEVTSSTAKDEAEHIAATTGGVRAVHNMLTIAA